MHTHMSTVSGGLYLLPGLGKFFFSESWCLKIPSFWSLTYLSFPTLLRAFHISRAKQHLWSQNLTLVMTLPSSNTFCVLCHLLSLAIFSLTNTQPGLSKY